MLCNAFFAPMHPTFCEINQKKLAVIRSYNIPRFKITMGYSETVEVVHQHEYLKSVEGYAGIIMSYRQVQCNNHRFTVLLASSDPMNRELCRVHRG
jgi:ribosomal protein L19